MGNPTDPPTNPGVPPDAKAEADAKAKAQAEAKAQAKADAKAEAKAQAEAKKADDEADEAARIAEPETEQRDRRRRGLVAALLSVGIVLVGLGMINFIRNHPSNPSSSSSSQAETLWADGPSAKRWVVDGDGPPVREMVDGEVHRLVRVNLLHPVTRKVTGYQYCHMTGDAGHVTDCLARVHKTLDQQLEEMLAPANISEEATPAAPTAAQADGKAKAKIGLPTGVSLTGTDENVASFLEGSDPQELAALVPGTYTVTEDGETLSLRRNIPSP